MMTDQVPDFDLYKDLEIDPSASPETIDAAWRSLVRRNHPDTALDAVAATERMKRLNVAHDWLSNPQRRAIYDRSRGRTNREPSGVSSATKGAVSELGPRGRLAKMALAQRQRGEIRMILLRSRLLSASEVERLVDAREARIDDWGDAFDAVERWQEAWVSEARSAREADRRRAGIEALEDDAFAVGLAAASRGPAWELAEPAGMVVAETVEALLARHSMNAHEFDAYFGAWDEVIGQPGPSYFLGSVLGRIAQLGFVWLLSGIGRWFAARSLGMQLSVIGITVLVLLNLFRG
jgi:curved DNA-binding protein CbpA